MSGQSTEDSRKLNGFLVRAANYTNSMLKELGTTPLSNTDKSQFATPLQTLLKKDIDGVIEVIDWFEKTLTGYASSFIDAAQIPAVVAKNQQLVNTCLDCYISNLEQARESLNKRIGATMLMPSLDEELELAGKVKEKFYDPNLSQLRG